MKHNVGSFDAAARTFLGIGILLVGHHYHEPWGFAGLVPIATAMLGFCPLYWLVGVDTRPAEEREPPPPSRVMKV